MERIPIIGPEELANLPSPFSFGGISAPGIPFSEEVIAARADTHILVLTPAFDWLTINSLREKFGTDPAHEPCMYAQDWYLKEPFADTAADGKWHLLPKKVQEDARGKDPQQIEANLKNEAFPSAITVTFAFFAWYLLHKEALWKHDFLWCSDRDHNGDQIYVGRYEDPTGINKNGFNVHRHLLLRQNYSAAPEVS